MAKYSCTSWLRVIALAALSLALGWRIGLGIYRHRIPPYIEFQLVDSREKKGPNGYAELDLIALAAKSHGLATYEDVYKGNSISQNLTYGSTAPQRRGRKGFPTFNYKVSWRPKYDYDSSEMISKVWYPSRIGLPEFEREWQSTICLLERGVKYRLPSGEQIPVFKFTDHKGRPGYVYLKALSKEDTEEWR